MVVKKVKGKIYVYEQYRRDGKVYTKYIGPLDALVGAYHVVNNLTQVNYKNTPRRLAILEKRIVELAVNLLWCGGWASNPRRPTPTGLKPAPFGRARAPPHPFSFVW